MMKINKRDAAGIYIHIPFCMRKCSYCDFLSFEDHSCCEAYVKSLLEEIEEEGAKYPQPGTVDTVFIGGGTPSVIDADWIKAVLEAIRNSFILDASSEITIEVNPGTVTEEKLRLYKQAGINRLSIGVQSFDDRVLSGLGRIHNAETAKKTVAMAKDAGFDNISVDLMFAVPGLTMDIWKDTLAEAVNLGVKHISFYSLQIEEGTPFGDMFDQGVLPVTSEEEDREMYHYAIDYLKEHGYLQYEVSNAALEGFESRHNMKYWEMADYIGMGLGASSYIRGIRSRNTEDMKQYLDGKRKEEIRQNTAFDDASEFVFTGLRKTAGIRLSEFGAFSGSGFFEVFPDAKKNITRWMEQGLIEFDGDILRLTTAGMDVQNSILEEFV